ncbi:MAG: metallophosphoesterase [Phycisphaerae bacterium]
MRILITADLHYNIKRSRTPAEQIAQDACRRGGDAIILLGDTAGADLETFAEALRLFADFPGRRLLVPGNHCLWTTPDGPDSLHRYHQLLPEVARAEGFAVLDHEPVLIEDTALVGCMGWYDYSMRDEELGVPLAFYRAKASPGAARYYGMDEVLEPHRAQLTERHLRMGVRWLDGWNVRLGMTDEEFTALLNRRLARQLADVAPRVDRIVVLMHHLPFAQLLPEHRPDRFAFAAAYLGATCLGQTLLDCPKVRYVYCGHSHWPADRTVGHVRAVNVGSTYKSKQLEVLEL